MKPGEYIGSDGRAHNVRSVMLDELDDACNSATMQLNGGAWLTYKKHLLPSHPDFAAAVAALQALIQPKQAVPLAGVHPGVGLRWCGEEAAFEWVGAGTSRQYLYRFRDGQVEYLSECGEWIHFGVDMDAIFDAGRRYEREWG